MTIIRLVLFYVLSLYLLLLIARLVIDWIQAFSRSWTPTGILAAIAEIIFMATDPPLRLLRRYIRPVRIGSVALDLSYTLLFLVIVLLLRVV
ncbi:MAG: YggT family protein [Streptosporangiaceae bacterium]